jgi:hypothetical protein
LTPLDFLVEEARSVEQALNETLRHDYGPERSQTYFEECRVRLDTVKRALADYPEMDRGMVAAQMQALSSLGSRVSLIERAHLGEFSWPFATIVEQVADQMFVEASYNEEMHRVELKPIVHVVAEGTDYQIVDDEMPPPGDRRIIIVAFPRQLKHHVLLHTIFGHELGHIAINAERPGLVMRTSVIPKATRGPLQDKVQADAWLRQADAPASVKAALAKDETLGFQEQSLVNWRQEIICDLFGLRLFGPAFAAAHRTIIQALCPKDNFFDLESTTHPTYPVRQRVLAQAIEILGWDQPVSTAEDGPLHEAERALIAYITGSVPDAWFQIYTRPEVEALLSALEKLLDSDRLNYVPPRRDDLCELVRRLSQERPPISQTVDAEGTPQNRDISGTHCLYAGWSYWFGRAALADEARKHDAQVLELTFLELNRLCDQALLQQRAIDLVNEADRRALLAEAR